jgi:hypothetical protein
VLRFPSEVVDETNLPDLYYLWRYFVTIADTRKRLGERLSYQEMLAWSTLSGVKLLAWEVQAIVEMDRLACSIQPKAPRGGEPLLEAFRNQSRRNKSRGT